MRKGLLLLAGFALSLHFYAQNLTQTIRGNILEADSHLPLPGATVAVYQDSTLVGGSISDVKGQFRIEKVPVGRYTVTASFIGYDPVSIPDVLVNSARQTILNLELRESITQVNEVVVTGKGRKGEPLNKLASVSARAFSIDETDRYAGSRGDPARMASNYAGVLGNNDASNDIIIRGNSPMGLLWRIEGVNVPNPNHFAVAGNTGGPVGILNNHVLANSDFFTGAFPAEYGNTVAGVFDLNMRNGNNEQHELSAQIGFLGVEANAEGPINRRRGSSYLAAYRYSTLALFDNFGVNIGTDAVPYYQDLAFKINLPLDDRTHISLFGLGGTSKADIIKSDDISPDPTQIYGNQDSDEKFRSRMGAMGLSFSRSLSPNTYLKITASTTGEHTNNDINFIVRHVENDTFVIDSIYRQLGYWFDQVKYGLSVVLNHRFNSRNTINYGVYSDLYQYDFVDSIFDISVKDFITRVNNRGFAELLQPYFQWQYRPTEEITLNAGLHGQWLSLNNNSLSIEPRLGMRWQLSSTQIFSFGIGRHSQMLPTYIYFAGRELPGNIVSQPNVNLGFLKSDHFIVGYDQYFTSNLHLRLEAYYQHLFNIPVTVKPGSYSVLNEGNELDRFFPDSLQSTGTGRNYGLELTLEKFFSRNYFFMLTGSLFDSKYRGSDGQMYNTVFNAHYVVNLLATREFHWGAKRDSRMGIGGKITWAGGKRYTPIDVDSSNAIGRAVMIDSLRNTLQVPDYFRADLRIDYKLNTKHLSHEIGLDLVNLFGIQNVFKITYIGGTEPLREEYQLGFLPIFYYRIYL